MRSRIIAVLLLLQCTLGASQAASERLVLVAGAQSTLPPLSLVEVRKLFLGKPLIKEGMRIEALRNTSDELLQEVFLQKVIFMSERAYERQLLSNVFREGGQRPSAYKELKSLVAELQTRPAALSYMWAGTAQATPGIKIIGELWTGPIN